MLAWHPVNNYGQHWLKLQGVEIAFVTTRLEETWPWLVMVNRQQGLEGKLAVGKAKTLAHAKKTVERWARANLPRLKVGVANREAGRSRLRATRYVATSPT